MTFKRIIGLIAFLLIAVPAYACDHATRAYATAATVDFCLWETDGTDFKTDAALVAGDIKVMKNEGAEANCSTGSGACVTDEGSCYSIALTSSEMTAARVTVIMIDSPTKAYLDKCIVIDTFGNASAQFPTADVNVVSMAADTVTASAIATDAIGSAEIAASAIGASEIATDAIGSAEIADGAIDAGALATDTITAAKIAADSITSSEIAATGAQEIADSILATTVSELGSVPSSATPTVAQMLRWYYQYGTGKFKTLTTNTEKTLMKDDGTTPLGTCTTNDDGTTYARGECS